MAIRVEQADRLAVDDHRHGGEAVYPHEIAEGFGHQWPETSARGVVDHHGLGLFHQPGQQVRFIQRHEETAEVRIVVGPDDLGGLQPVFLGIVAGEDHPVETDPVVHSLEDQADHVVGVFPQQLGALQRGQQVLQYPVLGHEADLGRCLVGRLGRFVPFDRFHVDEGQAGRGGDGLVPIAVPGHRHGQPVNAPDQFRGLHVQPFGHPFLDFPGLFSIPVDGRAAGELHGEHDAVGARETGVFGMQGFEHQFGETPQPGQAGRELIEREPQHQVLGLFRGDMLFVVQTIHRVELLGRIEGEEHLPEKMELGGGEDFVRRHVAAQHGPVRGLAGSVVGAGEGLVQAFAGFRVEAIVHHRQTRRQLADLFRAQHHQRLLHRGDIGTQWPGGHGVGDPQQVHHQAGILFHLGHQFRHGGVVARAVAAQDGNGFGQDRHGLAADALDPGCDTVFGGAGLLGRGLHIPPIVQARASFRYAQREKIFSIRGSSLPPGETIRGQTCSVHHRCR